jgi:hypothetical protein
MKAIFESGPARCRGSNDVPEPELRDGPFARRNVVARVKHPRYLGRVGKRQTGSVSPRHSQMGALDPRIAR